jgi:hypothetical protein
MHVLKMADAFLPVLLCDEGAGWVYTGSRKLITTVATRIRLAGFRGAVMEGALVTCQS